MKERGATLLTKLKLQQADVVEPDWLAKSVADDLHIACDGDIQTRGRLVMYLKRTLWTAHSEIFLLQDIKYYQRSLDKGVRREALCCNLMSKATPGAPYVQNGSKLPVTPVSAACPQS
jgi:hypothetical protein